jgi:2-hydroxy-3-keto-5-methylthiopentenyl-1-phosphate phosphatase
MAPYKKWIHKLYSIPADFSGPRIALRHPYGCETCGTCKVKVMAEYPDTIKILIGDSITDLHGAHHASVVFARNGLKDYLDQDKVSYYPFETFFDVIKHLTSLRGAKATKQSHHLKSGDCHAPSGRSQ